MSVEAVAVGSVGTAAADGSWARGVGGTRADADNHCGSRGLDGSRFGDIRAAAVRRASVANLSALEVAAALVRVRRRNVRPWLAVAGHTTKAKAPTSCAFEPCWVLQLVDRL